MKQWREQQVTGVQRRGAQSERSGRTHALESGKPCLACGPYKLCPSDARISCVNGLKSRS